MGGKEKEERNVEEGGWEMWEQECESPAVLQLDVVSTPLSGSPFKVKSTQLLIQNDGDLFQYRHVLKTNQAGAHGPLNKLHISNVHDITIVIGHVP